MFALTVLALAVTSVTLDDSFAASAGRAVSDFATRELMGHYDVEAVEIVAVRERDGEIGGPYPGYGLRTVRAKVHAVRNGQWNEGLNRDIPRQPVCETAVVLFVLCRPEGFELRGELEVEMVATTDGWKILNRNYRSLQRYPLAGYLICPADKPGATDQEIIRTCFASAPNHSLQRTRPMRRGSLRTVVAVGRAAELGIR